MDKYDELAKLKKLLDEKAITEEEYQSEKDKLLRAPSRTGAGCWGLEENDFCMFMHLSQLLGFLLPFLGLIAPIVMWATAKNDSEEVDAHGRIIMNWIFSSVIYFIVCIILFVFIVGIPLLIGLIIVDIIFVVIGAIKANKGERWPYPLSIPFLRTAANR